MNRITPTQEDVLVLKKESDERVTTGNTGQNFLSNFIYGKDNQRKGKANVFGH